MKLKLHVVNVVVVVSYVKKIAYGVVQNNPIRNANIFLVFRFIVIYAR